MREIKFREWIDGKMSEPWTLEDLHNREGGYMGEVMQFTGLHDKNGKEIYEGDIVRWLEHNKDYEVKWNGTDACYQGWLSFSFISINIHVAEYLEVIGNIYENPELLK